MSCRRLGIGDKDWSCASGDDEDKVDKGDMVDKGDKIDKGDKDDTDELLFIVQATRGVGGWKQGLESCKWRRRGQG